MRQSYDARELQDDSSDDSRFAENLVGLAVDLSLFGRRKIAHIKFLGGARLRIAGVARIGHRQSQPIQAAIASAVCFSVGAAVPVIATAIVPLPDVVIFVSPTSLILLAALGALAARTGGASVATGSMRAMLWGALATTVTAGVGELFGTIV
jgi:VIT1/CCC1 family predicted Fe2+/Mn2+ transporter